MPADAFASGSAPTPEPAAGDLPGEVPGKVPEREISLREALLLAQQWQREERFAEAEALYRQLLHHRPDDPDLLQFFGVLRHQQGHQDDALALLERSLRLQPNNPGAWINLANVLIEHGLHDDAAKALGNVIALDPTSVRAHNNLGTLHLRRGETALAEAALTRAVELGPDLSWVHCNLASLYYRTGRLDLCARHGLLSIGLRKDNAQAFKLLARALAMMDRRDEAVAALREWAHHEPDSAEPAHYLAAIGATAVPPRASDGYVQSVFDRFADSFDAQLERLGYQGPKLVCAEFERLRPALPEAPDVLDAGCGTGLCGPLLKPLSGRLEGVDLSSGMLRRAQARGHYAALHQAELTAFLHAHPERYHAVVSADVLIYFGDLGPPLAAVRRSLRPDGLLVASVELLEAGDAPFTLGLHGRYSHTPAHVCLALQAHGLALIRMEVQVLRHELALPVRSLVFSACRAD